MADLLALRAKIESNVDVVENLQNLNALLITDTSGPTVSKIISTVSLPVLFSCLQTDDQEQVYFTCAILDKLLSHLPATELVRYGHYIELGLQYPGAKVAKTCLQALLHLSTDGGVQELIQAPTMLHLITHLLGGEDLQCASLAAKVLLQFSTRHEILEKLKDQWLPELGELLNSSDTIRYRVFDLLVQTCLEGGSKCFVIIQDTGYFNKLVAELNTSDPLVKMNCIEVLSSLTEIPEGVGFLQSSKVLGMLYQSLTDEMGAIVVPGEPVIEKGV